MVGTVCTFNTAMEDAKSVYRLLKGANTTRVNLQNKAFFEQGMARLDEAKRQVIFSCTVKEKDLEGKVYYNNVTLTCDMDFQLIHVLQINSKGEVKKSFMAPEDPNDSLVFIKTKIFLGLISEKYKKVDNSVDLSPKLSDIIEMRIYEKLGFSGELTCTRKEKDNKIHLLYASEKEARMELECIKKITKLDLKIKPSQNTKKYSFCLPATVQNEFKKNIGIDQQFFEKYRLEKIKKFYAKQAGFFSIRKYTLFAGNPDLDKIKLNLKQRAKNHKGGASEKTLDYLEFMLKK